MGPTSQYCVFDEDNAVSMKDFYSIYKDKLPMLAIIIDGLYGMTRYDTFDNYQVMRIHAVSSQPRVVAVPSSAAKAHGYFYYTIPVSYWTKFNVVKGHNTVESSQDLTTILKGNNFPINVAFDCDPQLRLKVGTSTEEVSGIGNLLLTRQYEHKYFLINCIYGEDFEMMSQHTKLALSEEITATPVTGLTDRTDEEFRALVKRLDDEVINGSDVFDITYGHPEIDSHSMELQDMLQGSCGVLEGTEPLIDFQALCPESKGPPPPVPSRRIVEEDAGGLYEEIDSNYEISPPAVPKRNPIDVRNESDAKSKTKKSGGGVGVGAGLRHLFGKKKSKPKDDTSHHDYLNTNIGRAEVKPMLAVSSSKGFTPPAPSPTPLTKTWTSPVVKPDRPSKDIYDQLEKQEDSDDGGEYYESCDVIKMHQEALGRKEPDGYPGNVSGGNTPAKTLSHSSSSLVDTLDVTVLSIEEVVGYLETLKLGKYASEFKANMIDGTILSELDKQDLTQQFGMSSIEAIRLVAFARNGHIPK